MNQPLLTQWFPGHIKPVRRGVYMLRDGSNALDGYQYWDGKYWYGWCFSIRSAYLMRHERPASHCHQNDDWRGLATPPQSNA